jgi:hypothetical protein
MLKLILTICLTTLISSYTLNDLVSYNSIYIGKEYKNEANGNSITLVKADHFSLVRRLNNREYDLFFKIQFDAGSKEKSETLLVNAYAVSHFINLEIVY